MRTGATNAVAMRERATDRAKFRLEIAREERGGGRGGQESVNPNKPFTRALRAVGIPGNGANDMPEIAGPEWNLSGILRRFRRIRNSEDGF